MKYQKKVNARISVGAVYMLIGVAIIALSAVNIIDNDFIYPFGAAFAAVGFVQIVKNIRLIRNPKTMERREIAETDERNVMIWEKARSLTLSVFSVLGGIAIIILYLIEQFFAGQIVAYTMYGLLTIYWICYLIIKRKY